MALAATLEYLEYGFDRILFRKPATGIAVTGSATNTLSATAHGLANGAVVSFSGITTLALSTATRYYVINTAANTFQVATTPGGSAVAVGNSGSATALSFTDYEVYKPNQATVDPQTDTYTWKGGDTTVTLESLTGLRLNLDMASVPAGVHSALFSKSEITVSGADNAIGYGGGNDKSGTTVGLVLYRHAKKLVSGAEVGTVTRVYEYPAGTLTTRALPGVQSGDVGSLFGYSFSATPGNSDVNGATISGMDSEDFFLLYELT